MTDRVHPSSKPATANAATTTTNPAPAKSHLINPTARPVYRPPQYSRRRRSSRSLCCCCCFWTILTLLTLILLSAIAGGVLYILYRPHRPQFSVTNLRIAKLNLTTSSDSSSHLSSLLNLTLLADNPNNHLVFSYEPFSVTAFYNSVPIGNGSMTAFVSDKNAQSSLRTVLEDSRDLDTDSLTAVRSGVKKEGGFPVVIRMDTKVELKMEWLKSKRVGIRVTCDGINAKVPAGKKPAVADVTGSECKVDLRIKIWKFSF